MPTHSTPNSGTSEPFDLAAVKRQVEELLNRLPEDLLTIDGITESERKRLYRNTVLLTERLELLAAALDPILRPGLVYNPADPATFGEAIANKLLLQDAIPLSQVSQRRFYGSGIYALYYQGAFDAYRPIRNTQTPIYTGKADPSDRDAHTPQEQGTRIWSRLREHADSVGEAKNLKIEDFACRYLVVASGWQVAAEAHLIALFRGVWNKETKICQGFGKHGDSSSTRDNLRSAWDTLHPGRPWASDAQQNRKTVDQIKEAIRRHYELHPPKH